MEKTEMFAVGHLALGYLSSKTCQKILNVNVNLPLIFLLSLISDIDVLIPGLHHRGPTHSIILLTLVSMPILVLYRRKGVPYYAALVQHALLGDFPTGGGVQMFWPLTRNWYGLSMEMKGLTLIMAEWISFLFAIIVMVKTKDLQRLFKPQWSSLLLTVPSGAILASSIIGSSPPAPVELLIPHLVFLALFTLSMLRYLTD